MTDTPARPQPPGPEDPTIRMPPVEPPPNAPPGAEAPPPPVGGVPGEPPPGGVPPPLVPTPGGPAPPPPPNWPMRILIALLAALVVLVAVIAGVLLFGGDDEDDPVAATSVPPTVAPTTLAPTTSAEPTTTTEAATTTTVPETTTTVPPTTTMPPTTTTAPATTTTAAATTTVASECAGLEDLQGPIDNFVFLDVDGIGSLTEFGDRDEDVVDTLTCLLGEPDEDSGYVNSFSQFGTCPGTLVRGVRWGPLQALFGDAMLFGSEDREFYNWRYGGADVEDDLGLTFPETGLGLGTTVAELEAEYGSDLDVFEDDLTGGGAFVIGEREVGDVTLPEVFGLLTDVSPEGAVQFLDVGYFCGE